MPLPNPCSAASCPWGPFAPKDHSHSGGCLAGVCSEPTTFNVADEVARVVGGMPRGRRILVGYYATGHSSGGQPTPRYVSRLLQTIAVQPGVDGIMTYTAKAALEKCVSAPLFEKDHPQKQDALQHSLGCIVQRAYGSMGPGAGSNLRLLQ